MKQIILISCIFFTFITFAYSGEIYRCIDQEGNPILTSNPQEGMSNCVLKDSYKDPTSEERKQLEYEKAKRKYNEAKENLNNAVKECVEAAEKNYLNRLHSECEKRGRPDNDCMLGIRLLTYLKQERDSWKEECYRAGNK